MNDIKAENESSANAGFETKKEAKDNKIGIKIIYKPAALKRQTHFSFIFSEASWATAQVFWNSC